jgi:voltage-gated potassium channel
MLLLFSGVAIFLYVAGTIVEVISRGVATGAWSERKRRRAIATLEDHYIICGFGRVGREAGREFRDGGVPFVVLDFNPDAIHAAREAGVLFIEGNGTEDEDLAAAGLDRARGLVASSDSDADNLYITLSARTARPDLLIVARASDGDAAKKLRLAGADRVVQPYSTAGREMAKLVLKPQVAAFLDAASATGGPDLQFEEIEVTGGSGQTGQSIKELDIRSRTGALVIALRKRDGTFDTTPNPDAVIDDGDVIICVGTSAELVLIEEMFAPNQAVAR